jgi:hypothetical protein
MIGKNRNASENTRAIFSGDTLNILRGLAYQAIALPNCSFVVVVVKIVAQQKRRNNLADICRAYPIFRGGIILCSINENIIIQITGSIPFRILRGLKPEITTRITRSPKGSKNLMSFINISDIEITINKNILTLGSSLCIGELP